MMLSGDTVRIVRDGSKARVKVGAPKDPRKTTYLSGSTRLRVFGR